MKRVYVLEHASWNYQEGHLNNRGEQECIGFRGRFPKFDIVAASREECDIETAKLLTGKRPIKDPRAGVVESAEREEKRRFGHTPRTPYGGQDEWYEQPLSQQPVIEAGENLLSLAKELLAKLPKDGNALIITHNQNLLAAEAILKKKKFTSFDQVYHGLEGYIITEKLQHQPLD